MPLKSGFASYAVRWLLPGSGFLLGASSAVLVSGWLAEHGWLRHDLPVLFPAFGRVVFWCGLALGGLMLLSLPLAGFILDRLQLRALLASVLLCLAASGLLWEKQHLGEFTRINQEWMGVLRSGQGPSLYWCNAISIDAPQRLRRLIESATQAPPSAWSVVLLNNRGGSTEAMLTSAHVLKQLGVRHVIAAGGCDSACALLWSLMPERELAPYARLGFHGPYTATGLPSSDHPRLIRLLAAAGMNPDLARRLMAASPGQLVYLDERKLRASGLVFSDTGLLPIYRPPACITAGDLGDGVVVRR